MLPLYFGETYHIVTDPEIFQKEKESIIFEEGIPVFFKNGYGNRHCRVYSVNEFKNRIADERVWDIKIFHITNLDEIGPNLYCEYAALFIKR